MQKTGRAASWLGLALAAFALTLGAMLYAPPHAHAGTIETVHLKGTVHQTEARSMLAMVNEFRTNEITDHSPDQPWYWASDNKTKKDKAGLKPLKWSYKLEKMAIQRAKELVIRYSHESPKGDWHDEWLHDGDWDGENIAAGQLDADEAFIDWREDNEKSSGQGHRKNMLRDSTAIGIACVEGENGVKYWAMELGCPYERETEIAAENGTSEWDCDLDTSLLESLNTKSQTNMNVGDFIDIPLEVDAWVKVKGSWPNGPAAKLTIKPSTDDWTSGDPKVVSVSGGKVNALSLGTTTIKTTVLGHELAYPVTVTRRDANLSLPATKTVLMGSPSVLGMTKDTDASVSYQSSDESVAKVSSDGTVTPVAPGKATITAKAAQTGTYALATATTKVTVRATSTPITVDVPDTLYVGECGNFDYECPSTSDVEWTTSDGSVLGMEHSYWYTLKEGTVTVTASVPENECWPANSVSKCISVVKRSATDPDPSTPERPAKKPCRISLLGPSSMTVGGSVPLFVHNDCGVPAYDWTSSDPKVARVVNGELKALSPGKATITCRCQATGTHLAGETSFEVTVTNGSPAEPAVTPTKPTAKPSAPKGTSLTKVSKAKRAFTAKWRKASGVSGYQVRWSTKSGMSGSKAKVVKSAKTTSKKVTKLKKRTRYYVQVRTYKVVKGKTYWSGWSKAKSVRTK